MVVFSKVDEENLEVKIHFNKFEGLVLLADNRFAIFLGLILQNFRTIRLKLVSNPVYCKSSTLHPCFLQ